MNKSFYTAQAFIVNKQPSRFSPYSLFPFPVTHFGQIIPVLHYIFPVLDQLVAHSLFHMRGNALKLRHAVDDIDHKMKTIKVIKHYHIKRGRGASFFLVSSHV